MSPAQPICVMRTRPCGARRRKNRPDAPARSSPSRRRSSTHAATVLPSSSSWSDGVRAVDDDAIGHRLLVRGREPLLRGVVLRGEREARELPRHGREAGARVVVDLRREVARAVEEERVAVAADRDRVAVGVADRELGDRGRHPGAGAQRGGVGDLLLRADVGHPHAVPRRDPRRGGAVRGPALRRGRAVGDDVLDLPPVRAAVLRVARERRAEALRPVPRGDADGREPPGRLALDAGRAHPLDQIARRHQEALPRELGQLRAEGGRVAPLLRGDAGRVLLQRREAARGEQHAQARRREDARRARQGRVDDLVAAAERQAEQVAERSVQLGAGRSHASQASRTGRGKPSALDPAHEVHPEPLLAHLGRAQQALRSHT